MGPGLRIFADTGGGIAQIPNLDGGISDDFERLSLDAFTTIAIPENLVNNTLFIGVSNSGNLAYDPEDPASYPEIDPSEAGGYALSIALTDPQSVQDTDPCLNSDFPDNCYGDEGAENDLEGICPRWFECYDGKHEP
ncbi:MAG: hypothetical protein IID39_01195, partial [Planctomycetes bacterium]|nr:hypothetical protein [Planctomycetota bacterium]